MNTGFQAVTLDWDGKSYTVPTDRVFLMIQQVEDALTGSAGGQAVDVLLRPSGPSLSRLASGFAAALRYAGAKVTDEQVYLKIQEDLANGSGDAQMQIQAAIIGLLEILSPPIAIKIKTNAQGGADAEKK